MFDSLLQTKLYMPPGRPDQVQRNRLLARLATPQPVKLVLVSAPAGYGKTTLVTTWLREMQTTGAAQVAWLSLNEEDSDPQPFFRYVAAAIEALPGAQRRLIRLLDTAPATPARTLARELVQDVIDVTTPFCLVLDDYHTINSTDIDDALAELLDLMPPQMTLVLTSRSDPGFAISRLRARGQLIELRADDLRFTGEEVSAFLQQTMHLAISPHQVAALEERTEGWIAGLQMAALSMQNRSGGELDAFVRSFTGSNRFVLDYLLEEVLEGQPEAVRTFLLSTAVLDRLSGPLCDAVTERDDGQAMLETLERDNLFVVPLDDQRLWYRYHHLFADVLRARATTAQSGRVAALHRRAGDWYAEQDALPDAVRHTLAARDFERAADLIELSRPQMDNGFQSGVWLAWAQSLPDEIFRNRPVLNMGYAWALLDTGQMEGVEAYLQRVEHWLAADAQAQAEEMVVVDEEEHRILPASVAAARAYRSLALGDAAATIAHAQQVLTLSEGDETHRWRRAALSLLGLTQWAGGDVVAANSAFIELRRNMLAGGYLQDAISLSYVLGEVQLALGQLHEAEQIQLETLQLATANGEPFPPGTSDLYRGLAGIKQERNELAAAERSLQTAEALGRQEALTDWPRRLAISQALLHQAAGDSAGALSLLDEAQRQAVQNPLPEWRPVPALRARVWIRQGELGKAAAWARENGVSAQSELSYLREFDHMTLARLLIEQARQGAEGAALEAVDLLSRLLAAAETAGRLGIVIEILLLQAMAWETLGETVAALDALERAMTLAEPEAYVRLFVDEGLPMARLLRLATGRGSHANYANALLAAFNLDEPAGAALDQPLVDPLSERELEVLALIIAGLKNQEIADELVISLNTVLYHTKNIYGKLGVNKRALAIARAQELNLIP